MDQTILIKRYVHGTGEIDDLTVGSVREIDRGMNVTAIDPLETGRRARTRQSLIDAGLRLLAQRPIDAIAIDDIVREAGVAKGSFYNHFQDKEALGRAIATRIRLDVEARVDAVNAGVDDPARRVARAVCVYLGHAITDPLPAGVLAQMSAQAASPSSPLNRGILDDVSRGLLSGRFDIPTAEAGVLFIIGVANQALAWAQKDSSPTAAVAMGQQLCSLLLRGLGLIPAEADQLAARAAHDVIERAGDTWKGPDSRFLEVSGIGGPT
jgi:AcrR family transcriptional regulator